MPDVIVQQRIFPYDGAQDSTKNPLLIAPKDIIDSNNIVYTTYSTKRLRPGITEAFSQYVSNGRHILQCIDFWRLGQQRLVNWDGRRIYAVNPETGISDDITGDHVLPTDETCTFLAFQGLLIIFFGGGRTPIKAWTMSGTIFNLDPDIAHPTIPNAPFGRIFLNSLFIPDPTIQGRILQSVPGDPQDFTSLGAGAYDLDINDGDPDGITAIFPPFFSSLYITKRFSTYKLTPTIIADGTLVLSPSKIDDGIGCISHNGVVAAESQIFFPSDWGWHMFESTTKLSAVDTSLLSKDIQPVWVNDTNFSRSQYITSVYDRSLNSILCMFPPSNYNFATDVWGFSLIVGKWYRWQGYGHTSLCKYVEKTTKRVRTIVGADNGNIGYINLDTTKDYGVKFGCNFISGIIAPSGSPDDEFSFNYISPVFVPQIKGSFNITYKIDGKSIETKTINMQDTSLGDELGVDFITGFSVLGGIPTVKILKTRIKGYGMFYQLFFEYIPTDGGEDDEEVGFEILGVLMDITPISKSVGGKVA